MERRSFLQAAAAAAMPAGKKIRAGMIGTQHAHADGKLKTMLESPDYEVVGVSEADSEAHKRKEVSQLYRSVRWVPETDLLSDSSIDLIVVETRVPDLMRAGQNAIAAGKHLHLDKPPGPDMAAFRELVEEARRKKLLLQTGYIWRFHEGVTAAIEAARKGWLGQVYMMRGTINTDLAPAARTGLAQYRGGMMFELGCHVIDRLVDLWGRPKAVRTWLRHDTKIDDRLADNTLAVFEYDHGLATISTSAKMPNQALHRSFELIGTEGSVMIQPIEPGNRMRINLREPQGPYKAGWQEIEFPNQVRYVGDFRELARALRSRQPLKFSYDHELLVQETLLRACGEIPS